VKLVLLLKPLAFWILKPVGAEGVAGVEKTAVFFQPSVGEFPVFTPP